MPTLTGPPAGTRARAGEKPTSEPDLESIAASVDDPQLAAICRNIEALAAAACRKSRSWEKSGRVISTSEPDYATAMRAQELLARLTGRLGAGAHDDAEARRTARELSAFVERARGAAS